MNVINNLSVNQEEIISSALQGRSSPFIVTLHNNVSEDDDDSDIVNDVVKEKRFDTPKTRRGIKVTNQYNSRCIS